MSRGGGLAVNFLFAQVYRPMLTVQSPSTSSTHPFSFRSKLPYFVPLPPIHVNPCRAAASALISGNRRATSNQRRPAENQSGSNVRAGRYWPVKRVTRTRSQESAAKAAVVDFASRSTVPQKESAHAAARKHAVAIARPIMGVRNQYRPSDKYAPPPATGSHVSVGESRRQDMWPTASNR